MFFGACLAKFLIKIAGANRLIFRWSLQLLVVKFKISSFSNKAALLTRQSIVPNPFFARGKILSTCFLFFRSAFIKIAFTLFFSTIFFRTLAYDLELK